MKLLKKAPLAIAVSTLCVSGFAAADGPGSSGGGLGWFPIHHVASANVTSDQLSLFNEVINIKNTNNASVGDGSLQNPSGNVGVNVAAGSDNNQANDAALAASDAQKVFASASIDSDQLSAGNGTLNYGNTNNANLGDGSLNNAQGNVAVNVAAGSGNSQQNALAASVDPGKASAGAYADSWMSQVSVYNDTYNLGSTNNARIGNSSVNNASGNIGINIASGNGNSQQNGLAIAATSTEGNAYASSGGKQKSYKNVTFNKLKKVKSGYTWYGKPIFNKKSHTNNATVGNNSLNNISGNAGVNVAAGSGNNQRNSTSIAASN